MNSLDEALDGLRSAIDRQAADVDVPGAVRAQVASVCSLARAAHIEPERVLVSLKGALRQSSRLSSFDPDLRSAVSSRVISLAIACYFADV